MLTSPYDKYKQTQTQTANSSKLLLMLYEGAIRFLKLGIEGIDNRDIEKANNNLIKTQAIINELIASLNYDYPIANDLLKIYEYMLHKLIQANIHKDKTHAMEVYEYLIELKDTWTEASRLASV
ncbi:flagellar export chaperone FliS [Paenibacillus sp. DXFW5]|uniref:Flagellar export chaperone FliS n=1 Tax=Paenibacillus rhizolycopersici TaxID=2780073 RepID=A0ABS2HCL1_9BACL|nr:flagellar export chaperone FliS [Paenibacillus rhizolycopersici]MBM6997268.1 flagellar export chaperone FliS [Paenibacillus rhizolycopersici]